MYCTYRHDSAQYAGEPEKVSIVACGSAHTQIERMRDGIYRVDFQKGEPLGQGIAMVSNGRDFKGIDQTHTYVGHIDGQGDPIGGELLTSIIGAPDASGMSSGGATLKVGGGETEDGFELSGYAEGGPGGHREIKGSGITDLLED